MFLAGLAVFAVIAIFASGGSLQWWDDEHWFAPWAFYTTDWELLNSDSEVPDFGGESVLGDDAG